MDELEIMQHIKDLAQQKAESIHDLIYNIEKSDAQITDEIAVKLIEFASEVVQAEIKRAEMSLPAP